MMYIIISAAIDMLRRAILRHYAADRASNVAADGTSATVEHQRVHPVNASRKRQRLDGGQAATRTSTRLFEKAWYTYV